MNNMGPFAETQWPAWAYNANANTFTGYAQLPSYAAYLPESMEIYSAQQSHLVHHQQMARATESKPRLSKEEVEILEAEFQKNHKPNSSTKKALAEQMRVDNARINNWFQNRRAREKKEKNIREYAALQKREKESAASPAGHHSDDEGYSDRVVSSAPFPDSRRPSVQVETKELSLSAELATSEHDSETSQSDVCSSPDLSAHATPDRAPSFDSHDTQDFTSLKQNGFQTASMPGSTSQFISMPESNTIQEDARVSFVPYSQFPQLVIPDGESEATPSLSQQCFAGAVDLSPESAHDSYSQYSESDFDENTISPTEDSQGFMKSPPSMDIASRRNRRPPHLAINASRSYSASSTRTGAETRRSDVGSSMRRVASATGTVRVSKPLGTPRSPFFDRNPDVLFQLNRSPSFTAETATIAPPTPNTPIVSAQHGMCEMNLASALPGNSKFTPDMIIIQDPTLRTPPATPGIMDNMLALNPTYDGPIPDEPLMTPGLGGFPSDFELPGASNHAPNYVTNGCSSQPQTPSYTPQMGPNYFGYAGGNAEYNWSDASVSAKSSPSQSHRQVQFMNMTPSNFAYVDK
ncbi:hypothetical protein BGZ63DRAFT_119764 [Mariannaea sp. PMI_226]|nr:hypothetical protein BGZ63DRAFT_119764 [Mariannaea sp. PMI_226]